MNPPDCGKKQTTLVYEYRTLTCYSVKVEVSSVQFDNEIITQQRKNAVDTHLAISY